MQQNCTVTATTGKAAFNINGITVHSLLNLPVGARGNTDLKGQALVRLQDKLQNIKYILIDEYSMLGQTLLGWIDKRCRQATGQQDEVFGNVSIILIGDPAQLPPVADKPFSRQPSAVPNLSEFENAMRLFYGNDQVATYNYDQLLKLRQPIAQIEARHSSPIAKAVSSEEIYGIIPTLFLATKASVMLTMNLWSEVGLCNGATGKVIDIIYADNHSPPNLPVAVIVQFDHYTGPSFIDTLPKCVPIPPVTITSKYLETFHERQQLPSKLAWAITIHKSQGLTLPKAWIDIGPSEKAAGITYVAISRVRSLKSCIIEPVTFERLTRNTVIQSTNKMSSPSSPSKRKDNATQSSPAVDSNITLNQLPTLTRNQKVNVTGILTLGQKPAKEVKKRNSENGKVKEDCVIEDATGNAILHIWDNLIDKVQNSKSYTFKNLSVKNYSGNTMLGTTASTTFDEVQTELKQVKGPDLLENKDKKVTVQEFKFVDKLNISFQCQ
ncbi:ATP-dependent DNA helicase PIF1-like [Montipora foliosa]|uniref:ATP-dependent DNA helicase PIF1-like n=1 Tax=Montipora foliosa TaxID=591990 RepID=UPI0035F1301F